MNSVKPGTAIAVAAALIALVIVLVHGPLVAAIGVAVAGGLAGAYLSTKGGASDGKATGIN